MSTSLYVLVSARLRVHAVQLAVCCLKLPALTKQPSEDKPVLQHWGIVSYNNHVNPQIQRY